MISSPLRFSLLRCRSSSFRTVSRHTEGCLAASAHFHFAVLVHTSRYADAVYCNGNNNACRYVAFDADVATQMYLIAATTVERHAVFRCRFFFFLRADAMPLSRY